MSPSFRAEWTKTKTNRASALYFSKFIYFHTHHVMIWQDYSQNCWLYLQGLNPVKYSDCMSSTMKDGISAVESVSKMEIEFSKSIFEIKQKSDGIPLSGTLAKYKKVVKTTSKNKFLSGKKYSYRIVEKFNIFFFGSPFQGAFHIKRGDLSPRIHAAFLRIIKFNFRWMDLYRWSV